MILVCFGHRQQVGKDTCAKYLCTILKTETRGMAIRTVGFADKIKQQTHELYAWAGLKPGDYYEEHPLEKEIVLPLIGKSPRQIWIEFGNYCRDIYEMTWIDYVVRAFKDKVDVLVVKDLRFPNEFDAAMRCGGKLFKVERESVPYMPDKADSCLRDLPDDSWTSVLHNDGTLGDLYSLIFQNVWEKHVKALIPQSKRKQ